MINSLVKNYFIEHSKLYPVREHRRGRKKQTIILEKQLVIIKRQILQEDV
jgi:hypothetical protein